MSDSVTNSKVSPQVSTTTIRRPPFYYVWLKAITNQGSARDVDEITVLSYFTEALTGFLGVTGASIPTDILKCKDGDVFLRVPYEDSRAVIEALNTGREGWKIQGGSTWLGGLCMGSGSDSFC